MIRTSSPYALCHQLSNGADVSIAPQPQTQIHAPSGARNPQKLTPAFRSASVPKNVVLIATYPELRPAIRPPAWMSRCAGVQNESRPIDMCHEMSQYTPTITHAAARTAVYACQRDDDERPSMRGGRVESREESRAWLPYGESPGVMLEKTHLLAKMLRLDRLLSEQPLKLARRRRRVAREMIVHVAEHLPALLGVRPEHRRPVLEIARAVELDARVVDDALVDAHPPHVEKVGGRTRDEIHHLLSLNPAAVAQRERHVVLGQQREHAVVNPTALSNSIANRMSRGSFGRNCATAGSSVGPKSGPS